jgi:recombination protein RecA
VPGAPPLHIFVFPPATCDRCRQRVLEYLNQFTPSQETTLPTTSNKNLGAVVDAIEKQFGKGSITSTNVTQATDTRVEVIPTGSVALDAALGIGGWPRGRVVEVFGPRDTDKMTLALCAVRQAQQLGGTCAFIDAEHSFNPDSAQDIGVALEQLLISQPDCGEQALEIADQLVRSGAVDLVIINSVEELIPKAVIEGDAADATGFQSRLMSQALRKLTAATHRQNATVMFIHHRESSGIAGGPCAQLVGGGVALKFYASIRVELRRIGDVIRDRDKVIGVRVCAKAVKNKCAPPFREADFELWSRGNRNCELQLVDLGLTHGLLEKRGPSYLLDGERLGKRESAATFLATHPEVAKSLRARLLTAMAGASPAPPAEGKET